MKWFSQSQFFAFRVLDVGALVLLPGEKPLVVCFVLGEEQRHIALAGKDEFTQQQMSRRDRARDRRCLDLLEVWFLGRSVRLGNPRRPVVPEPQRWQEMQFCHCRSPVGRRDPIQTRSLDVGHCEGRFLLTSDTYPREIPVESCL